MAGRMRTARNFDVIEASLLAGPVLVPRCQSSTVRLTITRQGARKDSRFSIGGLGSAS